MALQQNHLNLLLFFGLVLSCEANFFFRLRGDAERKNTEAPHMPEGGCVQPSFENVDDLPLKSSHSSATLSGTIADVSVVQTYTNEGDTTIRSANYIFPASSRAAVYHMEAKYGDKVVRAVIKPREQAQREYNDAVSSGREATLLQQHRPNVFEMVVGNICPGDVVEVTLKYTETLLLDDQTYSFMIPGVVGPRYTGEETAGHQQELPEAQYSTSEKGTFDASVSVTIDAGVAVKSMTSPTHKVVGSHKGGYAVDVTFSEHERNPANRDFILEYSLSGAEPQAGILLHSDEEKGEQFFQINVQPQSFGAINSAEATSLPPREYVFIVDVSGSMHGSPLETAKTLMKQLLGSLRPDVDLFNVVLFDWSTQVLSDNYSIYATPDNIDAALSFLDRMDGGGGTNLLHALQKAFQLPRGGAISRTSVVITDGYVSIEDQVFSLVRNHVVQGGENVFAFGIGQSVNRYLVEGLGRAGLSDSYVLLDDSSASHAVSYLQDYLRTPVLTDVKIQLPSGIGAMSVVPSRAGAMSDYAPGSTISAPDVFARRPLIMVGKALGHFARGEFVEISGVTSSDGERKTIWVPIDAASPGNKSIMYLWARSIVDDLQAPVGLLSVADPKAEIVSIGMKYNLLTQHTSFLAVNDGPPRACADGSGVDVTQALPLPSGVSSDRSGASMAKTRQVRRKAASPPVPGARGSIAFGAFGAAVKESSLHAELYAGAASPGSYVEGGMDKGFDGSGISAELETVDVIDEDEEEGLGDAIPGPIPGPVPSPYAEPEPMPSPHPDNREEGGAAPTVCPVEYGDVDSRKSRTASAAGIMTVVGLVGLLVVVAVAIRRRRPVVSLASGSESLTGQNITHNQEK